MDSGDQFDAGAQCIAHGMDLLLSADLITDDVLRRQGAGSVGHCQMLGVPEQAVQSHQPGLVQMQLSPLVRRSHGMVPMCPARQLTDQILEQGGFT